MNAAQPALLEIERHRRRELFRRAIGRCREWRSPHHHGGHFLIEHRQTAADFHIGRDHLPATIDRERDPPLSGDIPAARGGRILLMTLEMGGHSAVVVGHCLHRNRDAGATRGLLRFARLDRLPRRLDRLHLLGLLARRRDDGLHVRQYLAWQYRRYLGRLRRLNHGDLLPLLRLLLLRLLDRLFLGVFGPSLLGLYLALFSPPLGFRRLFVWLDLIDLRAVNLVHAWRRRRPSLPVVADLDLDCDRLGADA